MSLGVNYDTLNWQFSNDRGNTLIREKDKQKQTHLYFHRRTATGSRETCKMDAPFPPQGNYVPSALVCVARGRFVFRLVDVELRALNWHNPWQIVIDGRKINHVAKASGQLLSGSKMNTWRAYHHPKLRTQHDLIWRYLLFLFYRQVGKFFLPYILFHGFVSPVVIVVLLDIKPSLAANIWASKAITATFTLASQTPAKSHWDVWIYWIYLIWICNFFLFGAGRCINQFLVLYYKCCCCCSKVIHYIRNTKNAFSNIFHLFYWNVRNGRLPHSSYKWPCSSYVKNVVLFFCFSDMWETKPLILLFCSRDKPEDNGDLH